MISKIPITNSPNIKNIFRAFLFLGRKDGFKNLSKFFPNYKYVVFSKSAISLMFIYKLRTKYENRKKPLIYLPDYFCNESTRYLRKINANIKFYPFKSINKEFLNNKLEHDKISIFLFVNYFGQNNYPKENIINFLKKKDVWIIEDSTHKIFSKKYLKNKSDFILISPHKTFSIPNGAIMLFRNKFSDLIIHDDFLKIKNTNYVYRLINIYKTLLWIIKRLLQNIGIGISHDNFSFNNYHYKNKVFKENISFLSHSLLSEYNTKYITKKREQNIENWDLIISIIFPFLKPKKFKNTPYISVFKFTNTPQKYRLLKEFSNYGIPFSSWPDLPSEVINNSKQHKEALAAQNNHIFLPINEKVTRKKIFYATEKALKKYTNKFKFKKITSENEKFKLDFLIFNKNIIFAKVAVYKNIFYNEDSVDIDFNDEFIEKNGFNYSAINLLGAFIFLNIRKNNYLNSVRFLVPRNKFTDFLFTRENLVIKNSPSLLIPLTMDSEARSKYITRQLFVEANYRRNTEIDKFKIKFKQKSCKNKNFLIYIVFKDDHKYKFYLETNQKENVKIIDIDIIPSSLEIFLNIINLISKDLLSKSFKSISIDTTMYALILKNYSKKKLSEINNLIILN